MRGRRAGAEPRMDTSPLQQPAGVSWGGAGLLARSPPSLSTVRFPVARFETAHSRSLAPFFRMFVCVEFLVQVILPHQHAE